MGGWIIRFEERVDDADFGVDGTVLCGRGGYPVDPAIVALVGVS